MRVQRYSSASVWARRACVNPGWALVSNHEPAWSRSQSLSRCMARTWTTRLPRRVSSWHFWHPGTSDVWRAAPPCSSAASYYRNWRKFQIGTEITMSSCPGWTKSPISVLVLVTSSCTFHDHGYKTARGDLEAFSPPLEYAG